MAEKRMFSQRIVESDAFYSLSFAAQALYMHLNMFADDDGVVHNPNKVIRSLCISENDWVGQLTELKNSFDRLIEKRFLLDLGNGIVVIKHWRMNNTIRKDRYNPSQYQEELSRLIIKDNGSYTEKDGDGVVTSWLPRGYEAVTDVATQYSIVEDSIVESSVDKERVGVQGEREPTPSHPDSSNCGKPCGKDVENPKLGKYANVQLSQKELAMLKLKYPAQWERMVDELSEFMKTTGKHYDRHFDIITGWAGGAV